MDLALEQERGKITQNPHRYQNTYPLRGTVTVKRITPQETTILVKMDLNFHLDLPLVTHDQILEDLQNREGRLSFMSEDYMAAAQVPTQQEETQAMLPVVSKPNNPPMNCVIGYPHHQMNASIKLETEVNIFQRKFDSKTKMALMNNQHPEFILRQLTKLPTAGGQRTC